MITIRDMLPEVILMRPDLKDSMGDEIGLWAIRNTIAAICRRTQILKDENTTANFAAGTSVSLITPNDGRLLRIERVRVGDLGVETPDYNGTWNASTNTPTLASTTTGKFYIVSVAGTQSSVSYEVGDVVVYAGSAWNKVPTTDFLELHQENKPTVENHSRVAQSADGFPCGWAQDNGSIVFYPRLANDTPIIVSYSYVPGEDYTTIDFPPEAEDAIIPGAQSLLLSLPGKLQNLAMSQQLTRDFERGVRNVRATALFGYGGSPQYNPGFFAGRPSW